MPNLPEPLKKAIQAAATKIQPATRWWPAILSDANGDTTPNRDATVYTKPGFVYCVMPDGAVAKVFNHNIVQPVTGLRVIVGYEPFNWNLFQVLDINYSYATMGGFTGSTGPGPHHKTHEWLNPGGGNDATFMEARQLMPLRLSPAGGFVVRVESSPISIEGGWDVSTSSTLDLTSYRPSIGALYVLIFLTAAGVLTARAGANVGAFTSLDFTDIPACAAGERPLAAVALYTGQASIQESLSAQDVVDLRFAGLTGQADRALTYDTSAYSTPPTQAELFAALGAPAVVGAGKACWLNAGGDGSREYLAVSDGAFWWIVPGTRASYADDLISMFALGTATVSDELFTLAHGVNEFDIIWDGGAYHWVYSDYHNSGNEATVYRTAATIAGLATATPVTLLSGGLVTPCIQHYGSTWHLWVNDDGGGPVHHYTASAATGAYSYQGDVGVSNIGDACVRYRALDGLYYMAVINNSATPWSIGLLRASSPNGPWSTLTLDATSGVGRAAFDADQQSDSNVFFIGSHIYISYSGLAGAVESCGIIEIDPATWQALAQGVQMVAPTVAWQQRNSSTKIFEPIYVEHDNRFYYSQNPGYSGAWYNVATGWGYLSPGVP